MTVQYVNFVYAVNDVASLHTAPVDNSDAAYLRKAATHLKPLSDEQYVTGPACILHSMAKFSYVLDDQNLYWCVEWDPGLLVIRLSPGKELQWVAIRSPVPNVGGREPLPEDGDPDDYDDSDDNPQYNLIFIPWDAQYDKQKREWRSFAPANNEVQSRFENALAHVKKLGTVADSRYAADSDEWFIHCSQNIEKWCGEGVRFKSAS